MTWEEAFAAGGARCGGKGWNLARLARYGFDVPPGGVLTAEAYDAVTANPETAALIHELGSSGAEQALEPAVVSRLECLRSTIMSSALPEPVGSALDRFLGGPDLAGRRLAVRSSAVCEDSARASFAGVHESFLGVCGAEEIKRAMLSCFASLWTSRALAYRRRTGVGDQEVRCAIALCAMVHQAGSPEPACAGVAFSCDPRSGRRDKVVIHAAAGGGGKVVGGAVTPDETVFLLDRGRLRLESRRPAGATLLDPAEELALARQVLRVQWALGQGREPQDVEWAYDGDRLWLLQARPVTGLPVPTFPALRGRPRYWSNGNFKDALPGVPSTICWSLVTHTVDTLLDTPFRVAGYALPPGMEKARRFGGRAYFDFSALQWGLYDAFGIPPGEVNRSLGGHHPEIQVPPGDPLRGWAGLSRVRARLKLMWRMRGLEKELGRAIEHHMQESRAMAAAEWRFCSREEMYAVVERMAVLHDKLDPLVGLANSSSGGWRDLLEQLLQPIAEDRRNALLSGLMAGRGGVASAEQGYRVHELAESARRDLEALEWIESGGGASGWKRLSPGSPFRKELELFLRDFGHRAVYEADPINPRWSEDPGYIVDQVREIVRHAPTSAPRKSALAVRRAAEAQLRQLPTWRRWLLLWCLRKFQKGLALREAAKSAHATTLVPFRALMLEVGRRLTEAGQLESANDAFHLASIDLECLLRGEWDGQGAAFLCADRKEWRDCWLSSPPPADVLVEPADGPLQPLEEQAVDAGRSMPQAEWHGTVVSAGRARGRARVVRHPAEGARLVRGEILVAPSTDAGWSPLFLRAAGIILESGGYLSHGSIVAREFGIPAVVNIPGILDLLSGEPLVLVDGDRGTVRTIEI